MPKRFSWIIPNQLAVGSFPHQTSSASQLRREGITAVLCLNEEDEQPVPNDIQNGFLWKRVPIPDGFTGGVPSEEQFDDALKILNRWQRKGHIVYVHCLAGVGRSASVCCLYVAQKQGLALEDAIAFVKEQHHYASPDKNQVQVMQAYLESTPS
ncbi:dual specificity protein phosphatase [Acaryochloris sp. IP29b_bin.148]|uniref:protein-tyrosine phosphatase family protein n=1 Tax=Acaryochloris sp. IP29b_bin.148 TaxID=2969218 RepID=UPI0026216E43|nr:dual specificity protein phosphatase [Acaryochloris sp. IP29b_bin.148]